MKRLTPKKVAFYTTDNTPTVIIDNVDNLLQENARVEAIKSGMKMLSETNNLKEQALADGRMGDHHRYALEFEFLKQQMKYLKGQISVEEWEDYVRRYQQFSG